MIAQQILNGLVTGSVYALFALGFTLVFGVHKILNLAHGAVFMIGAFVAYYAVTAGLPLWVATVLAVTAAGMLSWLIEVIAFSPLRARGEIEFAALISSLGANLCLISLAQRVSNTQIKHFPFETFPVEVYEVAGLRVSLLQIITACAVAAILISLMFYLYRTGFGRQVRAVSSNQRVSVLLGINPRSIYFQTFFISGALAGLAGVVIGLMFNSIHFLMGEPYLLRAFVVVVIGGLGSIHGAVVAGLLLGVLQTLTVAYLPAGLSDTIIFALLFSILIVKPGGIFGSETANIATARR